MGLYSLLVAMIRIPRHVFASINKKRRTAYQGGRSAGLICSRPASHRSPRQHSADHTHSHTPPYHPTPATVPWSTYIPVALAHSPDLPCATEQACTPLAVLLTSSAIGAENNAVTRDVRRIGLLTVHTVSYRICLDMPSRLAIALWPCNIPPKAYPDKKERGEQTTSPQRRLKRRRSLQPSRCNTGSPARSN